MLFDILELLACAVFPFLRRRRRRRAEWTGFLEEIRERGGLSLTKSSRSAVFRTDEGKTVNIRLLEQDSTRFEKGIRYQKKAGEDWPVPFG